jgi:hypothetical protein
VEAINSMEFWPVCPADFLNMGEEEEKLKEFTLSGLMGGKEFAPARRYPHRPDKRHLWGAGLIFYPRLQLVLGDAGVDFVAPGEDAAYHVTDMLETGLP